MVSYALGEFVGTTILLSAIAFSGQTLVIIAAFAVAVFLVGPISGGHLNPVVTLWAYLSNKVGATRAIHHVLAQVAAALTVVSAKKLL